ncbi:MAG: PQQ-like beta-propeller repeat protein [Planctomycetes bacterium]|nr:PQQ-like beta-propeller repeat protein [Planctomycetota bacterium]
MKKILVASMIVAGVALPLSAGDWPNWLGPNRNGASPETGLLTTWPKVGPKVLWKVPGGVGYSSVAIAQGRAITQVQHDGGEFVLALDAAKGTKLWETKIAVEYTNGYGDGPRATPTIEGKFVYVHSPSGPLACLEADTGKIVWSVDFLKEFAGKKLNWGLAASPLVDGDLVYALPGAKGAAIAAFNKKDGKLAWKGGGNDPAGYSTPMPVTIGGQKQIIFFNAAGLFATTPDTGKELWRVDWKTGYDCNICTPLLIGKDQLFVSSGEDVGCAMFQLSAAAPKVLWESKGEGNVMENYWANSVYHDGYLYGISGHFDVKKMHLNCVDAKTGKLMWTQKNFGKSALTLAEGHLIITMHQGDLVLAACNPQRYEEKARVAMLGKKNRGPATIADKRLYLRDHTSIYCLDIAGK